MGKGRGEQTRIRIGEVVAGKKKASAESRIPLAATVACAYHLRVMNGKSKVVAYTRDPKTRNMVAPYESKFAEWIKMIAQANSTDVDAILIAEPWVIGDTYEEIIESLSRLGGTSLALHVKQRKSTAADN